mmetsp:Transcript_80504/g.210009  ORF Transcript_80504/g.210009 Transcript_80504/m.210009 type:complete len:238 (+) Transcript_80504:530-1243(+)
MYVKNLVRVSAGIFDVILWSLSMYFCISWSNNFSAVSLSLLLTHASIIAENVDALGSTPSRRACSMTRLASMTFASISDCSTMFSPSGSLSVGTSRGAYRGAFGRFWEDSGWGSGVCAAGMASRSTWGVATGIVSLAWTDFLGTCLASSLLAGWLLPFLASCSPSPVWTGFFTGTTLATLASVLLRRTFTEPAMKAQTESTKTMIALCCCATGSWKKKEAIRSATTHTAANIPIVYM